MVKKLFLSVAMTLLLYPQPTMGYDLRTGIGIGVDVGGVFPLVSDDSPDFRINNSIIGGVNFDLRLNRSSTVNFNSGISKIGLFHKTDRVGDIYLYPMMAEIKYNLYRWGDFIPYIAASPGMVLSHVSIKVPRSAAELKTSFTFQAGGGIDIFLTEKLSFYFDARYLMLKPEFEVRSGRSKDNTHLDLSSSTFKFGLRFYFK